MSLLKKYVLPYAGGVITVLAVLFVLNKAGQASPTAKKFTSLFGY